MEFMPARIALPKSTWAALPFTSDRFLRLRGTCGGQVLIRQPGFFSHLPASASFRDQHFGGASGARVLSRPTAAGTGKEQRDAQDFSGMSSINPGF